VIDKRSKDPFNLSEPIWGLEYEGVLIQHNSLLYSKVVNQQGFNMSQIYGLAYNHRQSVDYQQNGSIGFQARQAAKKEYDLLEKELDKLESMVINSPLEKERINCLIFKLLTD